MAKTFLEEGATVIISGRNEENLKELNAAYPEIHSIKWDIADIHSASEFAVASLNGDANWTNASNPWAGVRAFFLVR